MMNDNNWGWSVFIMLFWFIVLIVGIFLVLHLFKSHEASTNQKDAPIDIVKERYAKGEITKEQFEQLKKDLK